VALAKTGVLDDTVREAAERVFEPRLRQLDLAVDQIQQQSLDELQDSLERINEAIKHPESFGEVRVEMTTRGAILVATSTAHGHVTVGILPMLLERKRLILSRIRELGGKSAEEVLTRLANAGDGTGTDTRRAAAEALVQLRTAQTAGLEERQVSQDLARRQELVTIFERRAKIWQALLARESIASVAGGLLLLALAAALVIAMFTGTTTSTVITNAFLIVLGYFFGQAVSRERSVRDHAPEAGGPTDQ